MSEVFLTYGALYSPLGNTRRNHLSALLTEKTGLSLCSQKGFNQEDWYQGRIKELDGVDNRYEQLLQLTLESFLMTNSRDEFAGDDVLFIISTTKADITVLPNDTFTSTYRILNEVIGVVNKPLIISNACISGVAAINLAAELVATNRYSQVVVIGIDVLSDFVTFGFQSLFALSDEPARPFDAQRKGISLGEACGIIVVNKKPTLQSVRYLGGASSNDANHISGPSRTGEGLVRAINHTLRRSGKSAAEIDYISAHGTATLFNDEMESIAFTRSGLRHTPLNSFKGCFGHTLGAAGVLETLLATLSINEQYFFRSIGYEKCGTSEDIAVIEKGRPGNVNCVLKTASGFGGGNAVLLMEKIK